MGFSTSAAVAVVAIGALISLGLLYPAVEGSTIQISEASDDRQDRIIDQRNSGLDITSVEHNSTSETLIVEADNSGTVTLDVSKTDLTLDGEIVTDRSSTVESEDRELWVGGERLVLEVDAEEPPERVILTAETGVQDVTETVEEES